MFLNWCAGILNLFDVIAFCMIFSLDMKSLPVTISWLWSSSTYSSCLDHSILEFNSNHF